MTDRNSSFKAPFSYPQVLGSYLAVNAIPDACMLVDSADCATLRAEVITDNHDWNSTLIQEDGRYRIANTGVSPDSIVMDRKDELARDMRRLDREEWGVVFVYPAPITAMLGIDYNAIIHGADGLSSLFLDARPVDTLGDWTAGYRELLELLARRLPLPQPATRSGTVGIIGNLFDRNEADQTANLQELEGLVRSIGLEPISTWLSGRPTAHLQQVAHAELLIALPGGEAAAGYLAERTNAHVLEIGLPVGVQETLEWVSAISESLGLGMALPDSLVDQAEQAFGLMEKPVVGQLMDERVAIATEPHLGIALGQWMDGMGIPVDWVALAGRVEHPPQSALDYLTVPDLGELRTRMERSAGSEDTCVLVGNERAMAVSRGLSLAPVPLGFQSGGIHHLVDAPTFGFKGALSLIERLGNAVTLWRMRAEG